MLCYKDMTFCNSDCTNKSCRRFLSEEVREGARRWWSHDPDSAPLAVSDFSTVCKEYQPSDN